MTLTRVHYVFTDTIALSQGYSPEKFQNIVIPNLKEKLLNDNIFILKDSNNIDYIEDIVPQKLRELDVKEEEFLQQLISKHKLIVDDAAIYVKAEFVVSPGDNITNIYLNLCKESFILTYSFKAPGNVSLVNALKQYIDKNSRSSPKSDFGIYRNQQTRQAKIFITQRILSIDSTFPASNFF